jgi:deoxyribodipyrimidine photolyase
MTDLFLFRNDLRVSDNPGLAYHGDGKALLCVYVREPARIASVSSRSRCFTCSIGFVP